MAATSGKKEVASNWGYST